jgi:acyl dehydratase
MPAAALTFGDLEVGQRSRLTISFTEASVDAFMMLTGDRAPIH